MWVRVFIYHCRDFLHVRNSSRIWSVPFTIPSVPVQLARSPSLVTRQLPNPDPNPTQEGTTHFYKSTGNKNMNTIIG